MANKPKPKLPCDGGAGLVGKDEAAKCERRVVKGWDNG